jgi:hypothetical protein
MEILKQRKRELEERESTLKQQIRQVQKELSEIRRQIKERDETELQQELEEETHELNNDGLNGHGWKRKHEKRKRRDDEHEQEELDDTEQEELNETDIPPRKKSKQRSKVEELLEEMTEEELKEELNKATNNNEENTDGSISELYHELCKVTKKEKRDNLLRWYNYMEKVKEEMEKMKEKDSFMTEREAMGIIYDEINKQYPRYSREGIRKKTDTAKKVYRVYSQMGGKEKIRKVRKASVKKFKVLTMEQIEKWEQTLPKETEIELEIPETPMYLDTEELNRNLRMLGHTDDKINDESRNRIRSILMEGGRINEIEEMRIGPSIRMTPDIEVEAGSRPTIPIVIDETQ